MNRPYVKPALEGPPTQEESQSMVQGIKALFTKETGLYANEAGDMVEDRRVGPALQSPRRRATDKEVARAAIKDLPGWEEARAADLIQAAQIRVPSPWAGVPEAIQVLRPLGRYDQLTDDAWRLVKAFCEARGAFPGVKADPGLDRQDPALYNRVDRGQEDKADADQG